VIRLHVSQRIFTLGERFTVTDDAGRARYFVDGSFLRIPKEFWIKDAVGANVARLWKTPISFMPRYNLEIHGQPAAEIRQRLTLVRKHLEITPVGGYKDLDVRGDLWNMDFDIYRGGRAIGHVGKRWLSIRDRYTIIVEDAHEELIVVAIVVAIDHIKREAAAAKTASSASS